MKLITTVKQLLITGALLACSSTQATVLTLPGSNEMSTGTYNDFQVYSLDLLKSCSEAGDPRCLPSVGLPVASSPGSISDQAVVLQTADGQTNFPSPFPIGSSSDDRFLTPTGQQSNTYEMGSFGAEPGGKFTGDQTNRWEISLALLQQYLDGNDLVFLFDNNQAQNAQAANIFIWGQARIVDANGNTVFGHCYEVSNLVGGCADTGGNPSPSTATDYIPGITDFCVDKITGESYNIGGAGNDNDCAPDGDHAQGGYRVSNNLGTNIAEFAAFNQSLHDAALALAGGEYFLQLNIKYFSNNGGAEQLWICSDCNIDRDREVPEPSSLPLVMLGLLIGGISLVRARRK